MPQLMDGENYHSGGFLPAHRNFLLLSFVNFGQSQCGLQGQLNDV